MNRSALLSLAAACLTAQVQAAQVTNVIDNYSTLQVLSASNSTVTNTTAAAGAIGGFRTLILNSSGGSGVSANTFFGVDDSSTQLLLDTSPGVTSSFEVLWGGAGGTGGLGGVAFGGGQPLDLFTSFVSFSLGSADRASDFTWSFTDTLGQTATYTGSFPAHPGPSALPYSISLDSFANAGAVNWNSVQSIRFTGGNVSGLDLTAPAPFQVVASTVPEPGTWALLAATGLAAAVITLRRRAQLRR